MRHWVAVEEGARAMEVSGRERTAAEGVLRAEVAVWTKASSKAVARVVDVKADAVV